MSDKKKVYSGEVVPREEPGVPATKGTRTGGIVNSAIERVKRYGQVKVAELDTKLATEVNNLGDQYVRRGNIELSLVELKEKLDNAQDIQDTVKAGVRGDMLAAQQRVTDLKAAKKHSSLTDQVAEAELKAKLAKAEAEADYWIKKRDRDPAEKKSKLSKEDRIAVLESKLRAKINEKDLREKEAGGSLDEALYRLFDTEIGALLRQIHELRDEEDEGDEKSPYGD